MQQGSEIAAYLVIQHTLQLICGLQITSARNIGLLSRYTDFSMAARKVDDVLLLSAEQLKAITSPVRAEILSAMFALGDTSVNDLAHHMGRDANGLYYHIRLLMKAGLIVDLNKSVGPMREEMVIGLVAKRYQARTAAHSPEYLEFAQKSADTLMRQSMRENRRWMQAVKKDPILFKLADLQRRNFDLTPEKVAELKRRLTAVLEWAESESSPGQGRRLSVLYTVTPLLDKSEE